MKEERKETLQNLAKVVFSTGFALATYGSSGIVLGVLNSIAGNLASSYLEKTSHKKIQQLIQRPNPSELNHDLQKLIIKAVESAVNNIQFLYKEGLNKKQQKTELATFTKNLISEVKVLEDLLSAKADKPIYKLIESDIAQDELLKIFDLEISTFPIINSDDPFPSFFKQQFQPNLQLCFGELLKKEKNQPALIAYQREIYSSLENGIDKVIEQNKAILAKLEDNTAIAEETEAYKHIKTDLEKRQKEKPDPIVIKSIDEQLAPLKKQYAVLYEQNVMILDEIGQVKTIAKGMSRDLKRNWLEKNKVYVMTGAGLFLIVIAGMVFYLRTLPFDMVLNIEKNKVLTIHPDYPEPSADARIRIYLPHETKEKELTFANEIILSKIPRSDIGVQCKVELLDPYWQTCTDSIPLYPINQAVQIEPNKSLSIVSGRVLSNDGQVRIADAIVMVGKRQTVSDSLGKFVMEMPISERKPAYHIRIEKPGYRAAEKIYHPGSDIEFRLEK